MSANRPLVSILIPCYNAERWVGQTLECALAQTWPNVEIVVVNDGSTDGSMHVIDRFREAGVRILSQQNRGKPAAMNRLLRECSGEFIQYLDADDLLAPDKIELQLNVLERADDCVATAQWSRFYGELNTATFNEHEVDGDSDPVDWLVENWKEAEGMMYPAMWLVPRAIVDMAGPWREGLTLADDTEYFTRVVLASRRVLHCGRARTFYRSGIAGSLSGLKSRSGWRSAREVLQSCERNLLAREDTPRTRRVCALLWRQLAVGCYPYDRRLANSAMKHADSLHSDVLPLQGGPAYLMVSRLIGWRAARLLQRMTGRS